LLADTAWHDSFAVFLQAPPTLESSFDPAAVFPMLLVAMLTSHVASPRLATKAFATLVRTVADACSGSEATASSSSAAVSAATEASTEKDVPSVLVDAVLDGIWTVDAEIDTRTELLSKAPLWPGGDEEQSLADAAAQSKTRLADVVKELLVSCAGGMHAAVERAAALASDCVPGPMHSAALTQDCSARSCCLV
jgi:hypothetical protein